MLILILIFATVHSGLASLRDIGEKLIGERAFRVLFAGISLPLAVSTIVSSPSLLKQEISSRAPLPTISCFLLFQFWVPDPSKAANVVLLKLIC